MPTKNAVAASRIQQPESYLPVLFLLQVSLEQFSKGIIGFLLHFA